MGAGFVLLATSHLRTGDLAMVHSRVFAKLYCFLFFQFVLFFSFFRL
jgi:hypothetical protein